MAFHDLATVGVSVYAHEDKLQYRSLREFITPSSSPRATRGGSIERK